MNPIVNAIWRGVGLAGCLISSASRTYSFRRLVSQGRVTLGRHSYGTPKVYVYPGSGARLRIGPFVSIADDVSVILGGNHPTEWVSTFPFRARLGLEGAYCDGMPACRGDVVIEPDVWVGTGAMLLSGVRLGVGCVVAAGSVVTRDVAPYSIVGGIPARAIKQRFAPEVVDALLDSQWWTLPDENIVALVGSLSSPDVGCFLSSLSALRSDAPACSQSC